MAPPRAERAPQGPSQSRSGGRAPWAAIPHDDVVDAASRVVGSGSYEELDDLLNEVVYRLLAEAWRPTVPRDNWRAWITQAADNLRRFLVAQPAALQVYLGHPVITPAAVTRMNAMMDVLRRGMADEEKARRVYAVIHTYTIGFAAVEAGRAGWTPRSGDVDPLASELAGYTSPQQFIDALGYLLGGIR